MTDSLPPHRPRKRFGQHFLHDATVIQRIVAAIDPKPGQHIVEIGPGRGALTLPLLRAAGELDVVELDRDLVTPLQALCAGHGELRVHQADALRFDFRSLTRDGRPLRLTGNLPYNISTPLLFHLFTQMQGIEDMHFMLQKEIVDRMAAPPGDKTYGRLSVMLQYHCRVTRLFTLGSGAFTPAPRVASTFVRLQPHRLPPVRVRDVTALERVVKQAFSQRRKTLRNALKGLLSETQLRAAGIAPDLRAEVLTLGHYAALSNQLTESDGKGE